MSIYSEKLAKLKREIQTISERKKKKRWKPNQKIMLDFINGVTSNATFTIKEQKVILYKGDEKKGFRHILEKHYQNDLEAMDIVNIVEPIAQGIKLANEGVSNEGLEVYMHLKSNKELRLILKQSEKNLWVVTFYRKGM